MVQFAGNQLAVTEVLCAVCQDDHWKTRLARAKEKYCPPAFFYFSDKITFRSLFNLFIQCHRFLV